MRFLSAGRDSLPDALTLSMDGTYWYFGIGYPSADFELTKSKIILGGSDLIKWRPIKTAQSFSKRKITILALKSLLSCTERIACLRLEGGPQEFRAILSWQPAEWGPQYYLHNELNPANNLTDPGERSKLQIGTEPRQHLNFSFVSPWAEDLVVPMFRHWLTKLGANRRVLFSEPKIGVICYTAIKSSCSYKDISIYIVLQTARYGWGRTRKKTAWCL